MYEDTRGLVEQAIQGDITAFAALVEKYQGMVCGLALDSVKRFADAEDIAQETFVAAYVGLRTLRAPERFAAWLRGIAVNKIRTWLRKRKARREESMDLSSDQDSRVLHQKAEHPREVSLKETVLRAIEALPESQRLAITLYYMDGRSYAEVAQFMDVPVSTVKGRIQGGRKRLKNEMMGMVKRVFDAEKPGREQAVRILRRAVGKAKKAKRKRDYEQLLACCDRALNALQELPSTPKRQETRIEVLCWQGEAQERLSANTAAAITCYQSALEIATEIGDADGQSRAVKAILLTHGRGSDFAEMKAAARRALKTAEAVGNEELVAFCTAAKDLCEDPSRKPDEGRTGGFVLGHFRVTEKRGKYVLEPPRRKDEGAARANISVNLNCGAPAYPSLLYLVYGPEDLIPKQAQVGSHWRQGLGTKWLGWGVKSAKLICESTVEANDETVTVPAGRFRNCLRLRSTVAMAGGQLPRIANDRFVARTVTGSRWMWFAPGVGLVRLLYVNENQMVTDVVLVERSPGRKSRDFLPLEPGNWWRYQWTAFGGALMTETWRVADRTANQSVVSCATHSHKASDEEARRQHQLTTKDLRRSPDKKLQAIGALRSAKSDPAKLRRAARMAEEVGEAGLQGRALHHLAWQYEKRKQPRKALDSWEQMLLALKAPERAEERAELAQDVAGAFFRFKEFARMADVSRECEGLCRKLGQKDRQADWAGLSDIARWLADHEKDAELGGYLHGCAELIFSSAAVEPGNRGSGTCASMHSWKERPGFAPVCLGMGQLLALPVRVGKTWTDNWNTGSPSGSCTPVVKCRIEARREKVQTPSGCFDGCVRVRSEIQTTFGAGGATPDPVWQGYHDGVRLDWYAPGVGLVKVEYRHSNGEKTSVELAGYKVRAAGDSLLPNRVGNAWQYEWRDGNGELMLREFWRMAARKGAMTYLGFGAVEFR